MTMFSMKPKFDLREFLAVPAPVGAARRRNLKRNGMQFQSATVQERAETSAQAEPAAGVSTDEVARD